MALHVSSQETAARPRSVQCRECTIFIGEGYHEMVPVPAPDGRGYLCWRCFESLQRSAQRQLRPQHG